ncbi:MFS transporter [Amycolatopsis azurea]|uniref:MFS transporter n=1 Tax=Amycolatopsis azurea DSM 43854 TaxID=1238180 RepID=M2QEE8_9PSEU|nr:MFS transporter [Amycolatopsis azurea]EMD25131.1 major facilitator superfamily MFS_1 [Amycolatopsis azurea DSM 43854]OOC01711.1 MFS transporter [Amycolatopsis azurea DSM 43854]
MTDLPRAYRRLWWATGIDSLGNGVFTAALPLLAVTVSRDARDIALVSAATYLPWLLLSLTAGSVIDRVDRITLMWRTQTLQALIVGVLAALVAAEFVTVPVLVLLAFALGSCDVFYDNAAQAALPDLVPKSLLHQANGSQQVALIVGRQFLGPPLGSLFFALAWTLPFAVDAVSFVVAAILLAGLPKRRHVPTERVKVVDGLRWLRKHRLLRALALLLGVNTFCGQLGNATLVLFVTDALHLGAGVFGLLLAGAALGGVAGGLVITRLVTRLGDLRALLVSLAVNAVVFVGMGFSPNVAVLGGLFAVSSFVTTIWNVVTVSVRQREVPTALLGRVNSVYRLLGWGLMPLGALTGGLLAHRFGIRVPYPVAGVARGLALVAALPVLIPAMREVTPR